MQRIYYKATSVITILVVIAVIGALVAIILPPLSASRAKQNLNGNVDEVVSMLVTARSQTLASYNSKNYGVYITSNSITLFTGPTYNANAVDNVVKELDTGITISTISLNGGGSSVLFDRLKGSTSGYGTIVVQVTGNNTYLKTITIHSTGLVSVN